MEKLDMVYIIDDDEIIIYLTDRLLKNSDFCERVLTFTDAQTALEHLKSSIDSNTDIPEAILFDLNMPNMNGWEFIDEFKKFKTKIPTFVFTSSIDPKDKERSLSHKEIKGFITKPLTKIKLEKILRVIDKKTE